MGAISGLSWGYLGLVENKMETSLLYCHWVVRRKCEARSFYMQWSGHEKDFFIRWVWAERFMGIKV